MTRKNNRFALLILAAVFAFTAAGCKEEPNKEPISVNLSVPSVKNLAEFEGNIVQTKDEAIELLTQTIGVIIGGMEGAPMMSKLPAMLQNKQSLLPGAARAVYADTMDPIIINEKIPGFGSIKGFIEGSSKYYFKSEYVDSVNDYSQMSFNTKMAVTLDYDDGAIIKGKCALSGSFSMKEVVTAVDEDDWASAYELSLKVKTSINTALSISDGVKGMKLIMKMSINLNETIDIDIYDLDPEAIGDLLTLYDDSLDLDIKVYDNNNELQFSIELDDINFSDLLKM